MRIDSNGNLGIGTSTPAESFVILGTEQYVAHNTNTDKHFKYKISAGRDVETWILTQDSTDWHRDVANVFWMSERLFLLLSLKWQQA